MAENKKEQNGVKGGGQDKLHIFVNRRKFDNENGVKPVMTGTEIAALVNTPPEKAVIKRMEGSELLEIGLLDPVEVKNGEHFFVTRDRVDGGYGS
ncbi:MAG TPA: multiubiquitin domain-containing protein [Fimbriimonadaceae bacterium]|nr:multiubiquitin domain-containing protein [Fimbriimonadaceae bacterium]